MGWIKLAFDETSNDGAFSNCLISDKDQLKFKHILFAGSETDLFILFFIVFFSHSIISGLLFKTAFLFLIFL